MGDTKIQWATKVWNPVTGCTKVSEGCRNCYAERMAKRLRGRCGYPADEPFRMTLHPEKLDEPLRWKKPQRIFVNSMGDLFHEDMPFDFIDAVFFTIDMCPEHTFIILTKRPDRMKQYFDHDYKEMEHIRSFGLDIPNELRSNVWLGVTAENQEMADKRIPILLQIPAAVRFVSCEPLLGPVDLWRLRTTDGYGETAFGKHLAPNIDWVIVGGETGPNARPMHPEWVRSLRDQCRAAGIPFFFKQWGEWAPEDQTPEDIILPGKHQFHELEGGIVVGRYGIKLTGHLLDGQEWRQIPEEV